MAVDQYGDAAPFNIYSVFFFSIFRFKLPCLLNSCKKTQSGLKQVLESQEDNETGTCIATDVEQLEENLWKSDNDDDCREDSQTTKGKEDEDWDDFLNDDDIEEIMIFQTQSLQRKRSQREDYEEKSSHLLSLDTGEEISDRDLMSSSKQVKSGDDFPYNESSFPTMEKTVQKLEKLTDDDNTPRCLIKESNLSRNLLEKDNPSRSSIDEDSVSRNPVEESNLSRNPGKNGGISVEEEVNVELIMSCVKENVEEDEIIEKEQLPLREESVRTKQLRNERDDCEENQLTSRASKVMPGASSIDRICIQDGQPTSDSDDVEAQPEDHVEESNKTRTLARDLEQSCSVDKDLSHVEEDVELNFELQNDAECTHISNVSVDLLNDENEVDVKEKDASGDIQDTLSEFKPDESKNLNYHVEINNEEADETLSLPLGEGRWDDEEVFQGTPEEVPMPGDVESDDETGEMVPNESITLISDNEEEVCLFVCLFFNPKVRVFF